MIQTSDISIAAFLCVRGERLSGIRLNPNPRASIDCTFVFEGVSGEAYEARMVEYTTSAEAAFDGALRSLRKACTEMRQREQVMREASRSRGQSMQSANGRR